MNQAIISAIHLPLFVTLKFNKYIHAFLYEFSSKYKANKGRFRVFLYQRPVSNLTREGLDENKK